MKRPFFIVTALVCLLAAFRAGCGHAQTVAPARISPSAAHPETAQPIYPPQAAYKSPAWFVDVAKAAGVQALDVNGGVTSKRYILESTGSGVAIFDYDNDGWPDIFLVNGSRLPSGSNSTTAAPTNHLFHNNRDGTFTDVTEKAGLAASGWNQGVCVGDYDNDGYDDLYVTGYRGSRLYHNQGNGTFKDVTQAAGVGGSPSDWGTGCAFVDYDRDGKLDLMVATYVQFNQAATPLPGDAMFCTWKHLPVFCGPRGLPSSHNVLYHNTGGGHFADVSGSSGIEKTTGHYCFSVSTLDYDDDGWPDIYLACDSTPSILYRNNHDGTFTDVAADAGAAYNEEGREQAGMGSTIGDYDGDGRLDIFKTNFSDDTATLYRNNGDGSFSDRTFQAGLARNSQDLGWGTMFMDMDNDGWPDLIIANGHVYPSVDTGKYGSTYEEPRLVYHNDAHGKFEDLSSTSGPGITLPRSSRGLAVGDLWNDGRLEAVVNNMNEQPMVLVNLAPNHNHWLEIKLVGVRANHDAIGTRVTVSACSREHVDEVRSGSSYDSSNQIRLHFGLGNCALVDRIHVRWSNGNVENFAPIRPLDSLLTLREGDGTPQNQAPGNAPASAGR
jgi:hypothetical protein